MANYIFEDVGLSLEGDLELSPVGDLKIVNAYETAKSAVNFILRTDRGDYQPNAKVGSNLGTYIGKRNTTEIHEDMERDITDSIADKVFDAEDIDVSVVPFDEQEALCIVSLAGRYTVSGEVVTVNRDNITYSFPFIEGNPTPITV